MLQNDEQNFFTASLELNGFSWIYIFFLHMCDEVQFINIRAKMMIQLVINRKFFRTATTFYAWKKSFSAVNIQSFLLSYVTIN